MQIRILIEANDPHIYGGKAANLSRLLKPNLPVPSGLAVGLDAFGSEGKLQDEAKHKILNSIDVHKLYAVRSSALAEDAEGASWAGQFETFLNRVLSYYA